MRRIRLLVWVSAALGDGPVAVSSCFACSYRSFGGLGVETVLVLYQAVGVSLRRVRVPGKRNVLLSGEYVLHAPDIYGVGGGACSYRDRCRNARCLASAYALRDQVDVVDSDLVRRDVATGRKQVVHLLGEYGPVGDLYRRVVV